MTSVLGPIVGLIVAARFGLGPEPDVYSTADLEPRNIVIHEVFIIVPADDDEVVPPSLRYLLHE